MSFVSKTTDVIPGLVKASSGAILSSSNSRQISRKAISVNHRWPRVAVDQRKAKIIEVERITSMLWSLLSVAVKDYSLKRSEGVWRSWRTHIGTTNKVYGLWMSLWEIEKKTYWKSMWRPIWMHAYNHIHAYSCIHSFILSGPVGENLLSFFVPLDVNTISPYYYIIYFHNSIKQSINNISRLAHYKPCWQRRNCWQVLTIVALQSDVRLNHIIFIYLKRW